MLNEKLREIPIQPIRVFPSTIESPPKQVIFKLITQSLLKKIEKFWEQVLEAFIEDLTQKSEIKLWEKPHGQVDSHRRLQAPNSKDLF